MKKLISVSVIFAALLSGCTSNSDILAARSQNSALTTTDDLNQMRKQRANETEESVNQATKAAAYSSTISSGASAVHSAVGAVNSVRGLFGW